jgi:lysophospholipase L1-like esterase
MKKLIYFFFGLVLIYGCGNSKPDLPDHFKVREGFNHFLNKAKNGDSVNVVYFGGSITEAPGWRVQSAEWLKNYFKNEAIQEVNASIGGTNSEFGAYRFERDVAPYNPDLVFIEFAVNDSGSDSLQILQAMEGIVRKIWNKNVNTDICFIYTIKTEKLDSVTTSSYFKSVRTMEVVADHYGIPSINFGPEIAKRINNGTLIAEASTAYVDTIPVFTNDGVHPYLETGHTIYTEVFANAFQLIDKYSKDVRRKLKEQLRQDNLVDATMVKVPASSFTGAWEKINNKNNDFYQSFGERIPGTMMTSSTGDKISFKFTGDRIGLTDVIGPKSGYLLMQLDGAPADTIKRFDSYCYFYRRSFFLKKNLENKAHEVVFTLLDKPANKPEILRSKQKIENSPELFEGNEWYVSGILLNGNIIH